MSRNDWKIRPRLTLNLGLRWEGLSTAHELNIPFPNPRSRRWADRANQHHSPGWEPERRHPGVSSCTLTTCFSAGNFALAQLCLDVLGNQKTVIRSGYGIYYQRVSNNRSCRRLAAYPSPKP